MWPAAWLPAAALAEPRRACCVYDRRPPGKTRSGKWQRWRQCADGLPSGLALPLVLLHIVGEFRQFVRRRAQRPAGASAHRRHQFVVQPADQLLDLAVHTPAHIFQPRSTGTRFLVVGIHGLTLVSQRMPERSDYDSQGRRRSMPRTLAVTATGQPPLPCFVAPPETNLRLRLTSYIEAGTIATWVAERTR